MSTGISVADAVSEFTDASNLGTMSKAASRVLRIADDIIVPEGEASDPRAVAAKDSVTSFRKAAVSVTQRFRMSEQVEPASHTGAAGQGVRKSLAGLVDETSFGETEFEKELQKVLGDKWMSLYENKQEQDGLASVGLLPVNPELAAHQATKLRNRVRGLYIKQLREQKRVKRIKSKAYRKMKRQGTATKFEKLISTLERTDPDLCAEVKAEVAKKHSELRLQRRQTAMQKWAKVATRFSRAGANREGMQQEISRQATKLSEEVQDARRALGKADKKGKGFEENGESSPVSDRSTDSSYDSDSDSSEDDSAEVMKKPVTSRPSGAPSRAHGSLGAEKLSDDPISQAISQISAISLQDGADLSASGKGLFAMPFMEQGRKKRALAEELKLRKVKAALERGEVDSGSEGKTRENSDIEVSDTEGPRVVREASKKSSAQSAPPVVKKVRFETPPHGTVSVESSSSRPVDSKAVPVPSASSLKKSVSVGRPVKTASKTDAAELSNAKQEVSKARQERSSWEETSESASSETLLGSNEGDSKTDSQPQPTNAELVHSIFSNVDSSDDSGDEKPEKASNTTVSEPGSRIAEHWNSWSGPQFPAKKKNRRGGAKVNMKREAAKNARMLKQGRLSKEGGELSTHKSAKDKSGPKDKSASGSNATQTSAVKSCIISAVSPNELMDKISSLQLSSIPYPYNSAAEFQRADKGPLGPEWNTASGCLAKIKSRVIRPSGSIVPPIKLTNLKPAARSQVEQMWQSLGKKKPIRPKRALLV